MSFQPYNTVNISKSRSGTSGAVVGIRIWKRVHCVRITCLERSAQNIGVKYSYFVMLSGSDGCL